jgi:hypothetical protein
VPCLHPVHLHSVSISDFSPRGWLGLWQGLAATSCIDTAFGRVSWSLDASRSGVSACLDAEEFLDSLSLSVSLPLSHTHTRHRPSSVAASLAPSRLGLQPLLQSRAPPMLILILLLFFLSFRI